MFYYFNAQDHIAGLAVAARIAFTDAVDHIHPTDHAAKDAMLSVEMRCRAKGNEELRAIGVAPGVGHAENASLIMLEGECAWLIGELVARATGSRAGGITALGHEALDHAVKRHPIIEVVARQDRRTIGLFVMTPRKLAILIARSPYKTCCNPIPCRNSDTRYTRYAGSHASTF